MKNIILILLLVIILPSCEDELTIPPQGSLELGNFFATPEDFDLALSGCYDRLGNHQGLDNGWGSGFRAFPFVGSVGTDEAWVNWLGTSYSDFALYTFTPFSQITSAIWRNQYVGISRCNVLLSNIRNTDIEISSSTKDRIIGETLFLRGLYYYNLASHYGGVPIVTETTNLNTFNNQRSTLAETYARIVADMTEAIEKLPENNTNGRVNKWSAKAYLSKVYLQMSGAQLGDASAATLAANLSEEVVLGGPYALEPVFADVFKLENEYGPEYIFSIEYTEVNPDGGQIGTLPGVPGNWGNYAAYGPRDDLFNSYNPNDLRRDHTIVNYSERNGVVTPLNQYWFYKWRHNPNDAERGYNTNWQSPFNLPLIRYADLLLIHAEAKWRAAGSPGSYTDALALNSINQVRRRAFGKPVDVADASVDVSVINEQVLLDERRWELAVEGHRRLDLLRFGKLLEIMNGLVEDPIRDEAAANIRAHHVWFPIPQSEIQLSGGAIEQNPCYDGGC